VISRKSIDLWRDDALHAAFQVAFKDVRFGQFFVPMGRQPDLGQRPTFTEDEVGVKHCPGVWSILWDLSATPGGDTRGFIQN